MEIDLNTFLTTVYDITDMLYQHDYAPHKPTRPGKKPELSDSEVLPCSPSGNPTAPSVPLAAMRRSIGRLISRACSAKANSTAACATSAACSAPLAPPSPTK